MTKDTTIVGVGAITTIVADRLGYISERTMQRIIESGALKAYRLPGTGPKSPWRAELSEIDRYCEVARDAQGGAQLTAAAE